MSHENCKWMVFPISFSYVLKKKKLLIDLASTIFRLKNLFFFVVFVFIALAILCIFLSHIINTGLVSSHILSFVFCSFVSSYHIDSMTAHQISIRQMQIHLWQSYRGDGVNHIVFSKVSKIHQHFFFSCFYHLRLFCACSSEYLSWKCEMWKNDI